MDNYKYILNYINNDVKVTYEFDADVCLEKLMEQLEDFLKACGWSECQLRELFHPMYYPDLNQEEEED